MNHAYLNFLKLNESTIERNLIWEKVIVTQLSFVKLEKTKVQH